MPNEGVIVEPLVEVMPPAQGAEVKPDPATAADVQKTATPDATDENAETPEQQEVKKESRRQRKLQRERDARIAAETETRILRDQLSKGQKQDAPKEAGEPKREDFDVYEDYQRALTKFEAKQAARDELKAEREASQSKDAETKQRERQEAVSKSWTEREQQFIDKTPGYEEAVEDYIEKGTGKIGQLSDGARHLLVESDVGPQLLHHLATHSDVHERIAKLSPVRQLVELAKIEDSIAKPVEAKKSSDAPAPAKPNPQGKSSASKDPDKMSQEEYMAWRKQGGARWAR